MTKNEKRLLINGILLPIFTAIILSVLYVGIINALTPDKGFQMAAEQGKQVNEITSFDIKEENGSIKKSSFNKLENNSIIGKISVGDESLPLIYKADKVNANERFNINIGSSLPGEIGTCFAEVYKNNSAKIKLASEGDTINIDTFYSSYEYTIKSIYTAHNKHELKNAGAGLSRALVLYTDNSVGAGISNEYYVCVAVMKSGAKVNAEGGADDTFKITKSNMLYPYPAYCRRFDFIIRNFNNKIYRIVAKIYELCF